MAHCYTKWVKHESSKKVNITAHIVSCTVCVISLGVCLASLELIDQLGNVSKFD